MSEAQPVLTVACPDRPGIVHAVAGFFLAQGCNIRDSQQFHEPDTGRFFLRTHVDVSSSTVSPGELRDRFTPVAETYAMDWQLHDLGEVGRVLVMVSREGHCLADLLFRSRSGELGGEVVGVVSNHEDLRWLADAHGVAFHHLPVTPSTRPDQEQQLLALLAELRIDLLVLARYMQILSPGVCAAVAGRVINIHHSSLPSFVGARPYHQAYQRGVKVVGATAHYVTPDLDQGPIIEQEVVRVDHAHSPEDLVRVGRDVERLALARAVRWHLEHRVILSGGRTVVFR